MMKKYEGKYVQVSSTYYIRVVRKGKQVFLKLKHGKKLNIDPAYDLFLHKYKKKGMVFYTVSEGASGGRIVKLYRKPAKAILAAKKRMEEQGMELPIRMEKVIERWYLSPRYRFMVNPVRIPKIKVVTK